ncbi:MAG: methyltransferase domain-containing protein [Methanobacteriaceae archaeon]|nr:methyltransferase domain-containing protein [Methanobacteriaceae archaeon]
MKFFTTPYHYNLLQDTERLSAFYEAIFDNDWGLVYDLGTGSGILSYFAAPTSNFIFAFEKNPKSSECAKKNLEKWHNVQVINTDIMDFEFTQKADLIICEMLDTALIDEEQIPVLNKALNYLKPSGTVIPCGVLNGAEPIFMQSPRICYQDVDDINFPKYQNRGNLVIFNKIIFEPSMEEHVNVDIEFIISIPGKINAIKLTSFTLIEANLICGPTPMLNPPLFVPIEEIDLNKNEKLKLNLSYIMGGGLDTIRTKIKDIS